MNEEKCFIIDCHVHTYRTPELGWFGRAIKDDWDPGGTPDELLRFMDEAGIALAIMGNFIPATGMRLNATKRMPKSLSGAERTQAEERIEEILKQRATRLNLWACSVGKSNSRLIPFLSVDPSFGEAWMVRELENMVKKHGAKGMKLHPGQQWFFPNDPRMKVVYKKCEEMGVPIQFHAGEAGALFIGSKDYAHPRHFEDVIAGFPKLTVILIHFGHYPKPDIVDKEIDLAKRYSNVYLDISTAWELGIKEDAVHLMKKAGIDRIVWSSDWHTHRGLLSLEGIKQSRLLTNEEKRLILGENAKRAYNL